MSEKENKYSYFVSFMCETRDRLMPGNIEVYVEERISGGDEIRKIEERIIAFYNGRLKDAGDDDRVEFLFITNFILLSGGESPALPTDEEIRREAHKKANESPQDRIPNGRELAEWGMAGFVDGAKWMRDQISQKS